MEIYRKVLILLVIGLALYVLWHLVQKRLQLLKEEGFQEGMNQGVTLKNAQDLPKAKSALITKVPLKELVVKASYHTALDSSGKVTKDQIGQVLQRGVRFLDFEVYFDDHAAKVGVASSDQKLLLGSDVFQTIVAKAFAAPAPNPMDPLFIHLRLMASNDNVNQGLYNLVGMAVDKYLSARLYQDRDQNRVTGDTLFSEVQGKIVLMVDKTINPDYLSVDNYANCAASLAASNCYSLDKYVNVESGTTNLRCKTYQTIKGQAHDPPVMDEDTSGRTSVTKWRLVQPDPTVDKSNPDWKYYVSNYGVQFLANMFYVDDEYLSAYESMFDAHGSAFVPLIRGTYGSP